MKHTPQILQSGFAAIAAIFLVVLLAALGAFMVGFSNTQQLNSAQDVQGSRAYWAARGALEWAIPTVATPALCVSPMASPPTTLDGFTITVDCVPTAYTEGDVTVNVLRLTATASIGAGVGSVGFVERSVSASVER